MKTIEHIFPSWGVLNDGSPEFQVVIDYLKEKTNLKFYDLMKWDCVSYYYGIQNNEYIGFYANCTKSQVLTIQQFIELTNPDEKMVVYGIKQSFIVGEDTVLKPLIKDKEKAIKILSEIVNSENANRSGQSWNILKPCISLENAYQSSSDVFSIEEFEVI